VVIKGVACLAATAGGIVPFQAIEDPQGVSGFGPPFVALGVLGVGKLYIILIVICLRLFPGAELEDILLMMCISLGPADGLLLNGGAEAQDESLPFSQPVDIDHVPDSGGPRLALEFSMIALQAVELHVLDVKRLAVYPGPVDQLDIDRIEILVVGIGCNMGPDVDDLATVHLALSGVFPSAAIDITITDVRYHQIPLCSGQPYLASLALFSCRDWA
jgi:hypothetical protein